MGIKEEVSSHYLEQTKALAPQDYPSARRALVIGASHGNIGAKIVEELRQGPEGFSAYGADEFECQVLDPDAVYRTIDRTKPDTLVLAQAVNELNWIEDQVSIAMQVNTILTGSITATQMFVNYTLHRPFLKTIIFIGSMAYKNVLNGSAPYCAAKAGLAHFARCAGWELTPKGYRVFCVHPSNVEGTPMTEATIQGLMDYRELSRDDAETYWGSVNLMPKWLQAIDVAAVVRYLAISKGTGLDFLTGTNIELSGGQR